MKAIMKLTLVGVLGVFASGCWIIDLLWPSGFTVKTTFTTPPSPNQSQLIHPDPNVVVLGNWTGDRSGSRCGEGLGFEGTTNNEGKLHVSNARLPAVWSFTRFGGHTGCGLISSASNFFPINCGNTVTLNCHTVFAFVMAPEAIDVNAPPATASFTGQGIDTTYGMPTIEFYDEYGTFFNQTTATAVSADGTWLQAAVPSLAGLYSGTYTVVIVNATADGSRNAAGTATVWVYGNDMPPPPPDPDPDPCPMPTNGEPALECTVY